MLKFSADESTTWNDLMRDEDRLFNLYSHSLKDGSRVLRTPTLRCTRGWLEKNGCADSMEALVNICVNKALGAKERAGGEALIAGCVGPVCDQEKKSDAETARELEELIVFMADLGVESLLMQDFTDLKKLGLALETARKISGMPLAVFFEPVDFTRGGNFVRLESFCVSHDVELCGFKMAPNPAAYLRFKPLFADSAFGVMLQRPERGKFDGQGLAEAFRDFPPTMLLGGAGIDRGEWRRFLRRL